MSYLKDKLWVFVMLMSGTIIITGLVLLFFPFQEYTETGLPQPSPYIHSTSPPIFTGSAELEDLWVVVTDLKKVGGRWEGSVGRLEISTTKGLYPWRIDYEPVVEGKRPMRCGFFPELTDDWRTAYCSGWDRKQAEGAYALRLLLHTKRHDPEAIRVQIGNTIEVYLNRRYDGDVQ